MTPLRLLLPFALLLKVRFLLRLGFLFSRLVLLQDCGESVSVIEFLFWRCEQEEV